MRRLRVQVLSPARSTCLPSSVIERLHGKEKVRSLILRGGSLFGGFSIRPHTMEAPKGVRLQAGDCTGSRQNRFPMIPCSPIGRAAHCYCVGCWFESSRGSATRVVGELEHAPSLCINHGTCRVRRGKLGGSSPPQPTQYRGDGPLRRGRYRLATHCHQDFLPWSMCHRFTSRGRHQQERPGKARLC